VLHKLTAEPLDAGSEWFEPSTLQVTSFDVGNPATNVIPPVARARMNIRFNDLHSSAKLTARIRDVLEAEGARYELDASCSGESFLTQPGDFVAALQASTREAAGVEPALDTGGGTSDARFIARYCPVAELGAVGTTMHKANESTPVEELRALSRLYAAVIAALLPARIAA
jgi:succinyl-diaminopimelate desuccinylase